MPKVTPTPRQGVIAAGTLGLAAVAAAGAAPAHAVGTAGIPLGSGTLLNVRDFLTPGQSPLAPLELDQIPVAGQVPHMMDGMPVHVVPPVVSALIASAPGAAPAARSRPVPGAAAASGPIGSHLGDIANMLDLSSGQQNGDGHPPQGLGVLPLMDHVPLVDRDKGEAVLQGLTGNTLGALGPLGGLGGGLGGLAAF